MKLGLTFGTYAPLHHGQQAVIEAGLAEMDALLVLIYDPPETPPAPLAVRAGWLRSLYQSARVVEAWTSPAGVDDLPDWVAAQQRRLERAGGGRSITHVFSRGPAGGPVSRALGAIDRRLDWPGPAGRLSAAAIRRDPFQYRAHMAPLVYQDLISNVVFLGAPSSGKTTLAERLAQVFDTQWMPEYGREYWEAHQVQRRLTAAQLFEIAQEHLKRETDRLAAANRYLFTDTNAITTATFARYYHGQVEPRLAALAAQAVTRYDLVFVCDIDIPYADTWDRSGVVNRRVFQRQVLADLHERKVPYRLLSGPLEDRVTQVRGMLQRFHKYMNVLAPADRYDPHFQR